MKLNKSFGLAVLMVAVLALVVPQLAQAAGTDFGTTITNNVMIQYGSGPSIITTSTSVDFLVDRVLDWNIAPSTAATVGVFPGSTNNAVAFSVQNTTNGVVDILLAVPVSAPAASGGHLMYLDNGGTAGQWDAGDTLLPAGPGGFYLDEVAEDTAPSVLLVVDVPTAATTTDAYTYEITATVRAGNGPAALGTVLADDDGAPDISTVVQNVYNDGAGYTGGTGDIPGDGFYRAYAAFQVVTASLTATKTAVVIWDPVNLFATPKAIPLALVRYVIQIDNTTGTGRATGVIVTDTLPAETVYVPDTLYISGVQDPNNSVAPGVVAAGVVTAPLAADLLAGTSTTVGFTVEIQ